MTYRHKEIQEEKRSPRHVKEIYSNQLMQGLIDVHGSEFRWLLNCHALFVYVHQSNNHSLLMHHQNID